MIYICITIIYYGLFLSVVRENILLQVWTRSSDEGGGDGPASGAVAGGAVAFAENSLVIHS